MPAVCSFFLVPAVCSFFWCLLYVVLVFVTSINNLAYISSLFFSSFCLFIVLTVEYFHLLAFYSCYSSLSVLFCCIDSIVVFSLILLFSSLCVVPFTAILFIF